MTASFSNEASAGKVLQEGTWSNENPKHMPRADFEIAVGASVPIVFLAVLSGWMHQGLDDVLRPFCGQILTYCFKPSSNFGSAF